MSLESFGGFDASEPMSAASLEKLQEKMRKASQQIKAIRKEEKRHKKTEDELIAILLKFIKTSHKQNLVFAISKALQANIPPNFVLALALLGNQEIQQQAKLYLLPPNQNLQEQANSLVLYNPKKSNIPLIVRITIDNWLKNLLFQAGERPQKLLKNAYKITPNSSEEDEPQKTIKSQLLDLFSTILTLYLNDQNQDPGHQSTTEFANFILSGILGKTAEALGQRKSLG